MYTYHTGVAKLGSGLIQLPHDYSYDDYKPFTTLEAQVPFAPELLPKNSSRNTKNTKADNRSRVQFAKWVTDKENPMFSKTIVNRLWKKVMGIELIGDVMDLQIKERGTNPALTEKLVQMMKHLNFDTKAFLSVLYRTQAYQSEITKKELTPGEDYHFPGPVLRRLSAEQLWDSMSSILYEKPDEFLNQPKAHVEHLIYEKVKNTETAQLIEYFKTIVVTDKSIYENIYHENFGTYKHQGKKLRGFQRASDLLAPTRPDHFLSEFGASDRRQIESSSSEPTIPQALYLMNSGYIEGSIVRKPTTLLNQALSSTKDHSTKIETLSLGLLCRLPTSTEKSKMRKHLKEFGIQGQFDILWALLNSNEFKFYK